MPAERRPYTEFLERKSVCPNTKHAIVLFSNKSSSPGGWKAQSLSSLHSSGAPGRLSETLLPLDEGSLADALHDPDVISVEADCEVRLPPEDFVLLDVRDVNASRRSAARQLDAFPRSVVSVLSWGVDRVDESQGGLFDGTYEHGPLTGEGVRIYVFDTGVLPDHDEFGDRVVQGYTPACGGAIATATGACAGGSPGFLPPWRPHGFSDSYCSGHGTHCAGTAAGSSVGVAVRATIVPVQVLSCGPEPAGALSDIIDGLNWAIDDMASQPTHVRGVISMSLSYPDYSPGFDAAVRAAYDAGIPVVAAAGNDETDVCASGYSPLTEPTAIVVGAASRTDSRVYNFGSCVTVSAPGVEIVSGWTAGADRYSLGSGTSMSVPHVAGYLAALLGYDPTLTVARAVEIMKCTAAAASQAKADAVRDAADTTRLLLHAGASSLRATHCWDGVAPYAGWGPDWGSGSGSGSDSHGSGDSGFDDETVPEPPPPAPSPESNMIVGIMEGYVAVALLALLGMAATWAVLSYRRARGARGVQVAQYAQNAQNAQNAQKALLRIRYARGNVRSGGFVPLLDF